MVDDVLIGWTGLGEGIQVVHVVHVAPQVRQIGRNVKVHKVFSCRTKSNTKKERSIKRKQESADWFEPVSSTASANGLARTAKQTPRFSHSSSFFFGNNCPSIEKSRLRLWSSSLKSTFYCNGVSGFISNLEMQLNGRPSFDNVPFYDTPTALTRKDGSLGRLYLLDSNFNRDKQTITTAEFLDKYILQLPKSCFHAPLR